MKSLGLGVWETTTENTISCTEGGTALVPWDQDLPVASANFPKKGIKAPYLQSKYQERGQKVSPELFLCIYWRNRFSLQYRFF